eukprot:scaffold110706_cov72-Phaeocystis_antarctica.AAC.4
MELQAWVRGVTAMDTQGRHGVGGPVAHVAQPKGLEQPSRLAACDGGLELRQQWLRRVRVVRHCKRREAGGIRPEAHARAVLGRRTEAAAEVRVLGREVWEDIGGKSGAQPRHVRARLAVLAQLLC